MELLEIVFVMALLLLVFGPKKLPALARELGEAMNEFRRASSGVRSSLPPRDILNISADLKAIAKKLDIDTEGKNIRQMAHEIRSKIENKNAEK